MKKIILICLFLIGCKTNNLEYEQLKNTVSSLKIMIENMNTHILSLRSDIIDLTYEISRETQEVTPEIKSSTPCYVWDNGDKYKNVNIRLYSHYNGVDHFFKSRIKEQVFFLWNNFEVISNYKLIRNEQ